MSFSSEIKEKIADIGSTCDMCNNFLLAGFMGSAARISPDKITFITEHEKTAEEMADLINSMYNVRVLVEFSKIKYMIEIDDAEVAKKIIADTGYLGELPEIQNECCLGAFARGAFLGGGSISNPEKNYHLEFDYKIPNEAKKLEEVFMAVGIDIKKTERKSYTVLYIKEYEAIAGALGLMGAGGAAIEIFNISAEKDLRNRINRQMNCEAANMDKIVSAYGKHLKAILKLQASSAYSHLPDHLKETAELRVKFPEDSLSDLGKRFKKPIGKSGVNHRLMKLMELAEDEK